MKRYDTIIIGGGAGGTALGALLSSAGQKVILLEKNPVIGGRLASYERDGFILDTGVHIFSLGANGPLGEVYRRCGEPDAIEWIKVRNPGASIFMDGELKPFTRETIMGKPDDGEVPNVLGLFNRLIRMRAEELDGLWHVPLRDWISRFTSDRTVHEMLSMLSGIYFCVTSERASAAEFISCFRNVMTARSSGYPRGGCMAVPKAFQRIIEKHGGQVRLSTPVEKIIIGDGKAQGVVAGGETMEAGRVVSNADIKATIGCLADASHFPAEYAERISGLAYTPPAVSLKVALARKVTDQKMVLYVPDRAGSMSVIAGGMFVSPSNFDPGLAPAGRQLICLGSRCGRGQDWTQWEKVLMDAFLEVFPEARDHILWTALDTPDKVERWAGEDGCIIGLAQTVDQVHELRPANETPVPGLFLCSAEAGGHGIGAELAASSALELAERIL